MIAAVPTQALAQAVGEVPGVDLVVWSQGPPPPGVRFWVPGYGDAGPAVSRAGELPDLEVVQLQLAGHDGVPELLPGGVRLCSARGVHDDATAEHAVGLMLSALRGIPEAVRAQPTGAWHRDTTRRSLADSRVLVLGYGSIGRALASRLLAMKAIVTPVASRARHDELLGQVRTLDDLPELLPHHHVVAVLLPLSDRTRGLVNAEFLAQLPAEALVVNVARGPVLDTDAVLAEAGRLRFALDVTDPEPLPPDHPLWTAPQVLITPHIAGGTTAMLPRMGALVRQQLERYLAGEPLTNTVVR